MEIKLNDFTNSKDDPEALFETLEKLGNPCLEIFRFHPNSLFIKNLF